MVDAMSALYALAAIAGLVVSALVFFARPSRLQNQLLALAVFFEVVATARMAIFHGLDPAALGPALAEPLGGVLWFAVWGFSAAYLGFLGTVESRFSRSLRGRPARIGLAGLVALAWIVRLVAPGWTDILWLNFLSAAVGFYGLLVAVSYWRGTEAGSLRRRQAKAYAAAFGARDLVFALFGVVTVVELAEIPPFAGGNLALWFPAVAVLLFAPLAAYGILSTQLFDIDLRIKWTLEKSTVAAIFVAVFFAVSEAAQVLFADFAGNELIGVGAAALLVFFLAPLQRFADRVGDAAMPGVEDTPEYRQQRKREVYRASVEELLADEEITAKERRMLGRLQEELGLEGGEASRIEADVVEAAGGEAA